MRRLANFWLFAGLLSTGLHAATFYVSNTGNDSNPGTLASPWLTIQGSVNQMHCGDTLNVVANGAYVSGDATLPYFPGCGATTTIQSSRWNLFTPAGYRTNPAVDGPNYGKLKFTSQGIITASEVHGSTGGGYILFGGSGEACLPSSITADVITIGYCPGLPGFANGWETSFDVSADLNTSPAIYNVISPLHIGQKVYVINCNSCSSGGGRFQISYTPGGPPITGLSCLAANNCNLGFVLIGNPLQVTTGSAIWTSPDSLISWANGTMLTLAATNAESFGTVPSPFNIDTAYCMGNVSGRTFTLAATCGGTPITVISIGGGALSGSATNVANSWAFRGIEATDSNNGQTIFAMFQLGNGFESSTKVGNPHHFEFDHIYCHELIPGEATPPVRCLQDNSEFMNIHDSYVAGMLSGESQAINWCGSAGPTLILNNFLEAGGEVTLAGGCASASGTANAYKTFTGNYFYKPPVWKVTTASSGVPSGAGLYDCTDPNHCGGEWYLNTSTSQWYQVNSNGVWATTASTPYNCGGGTFVCGSPLFKDLTEHKNGRYFNYIGNVYNYSWPQAQSGEAFNNAGEVNSGPSAGANDHILIMNNALFNVFQLATSGQSYCGISVTFLPCAIYPSNHQTTNNLVVASVLVCGVPSGADTCAQHPYQNGWTAANPISLQGDYQAHNTIYMPDAGYPGAPSPMYTSSPTGGCPPFPEASINLEDFQNNLEVGDFAGDCVSAGSAISSYYSNSLFTNNALKAATGNYSRVGTGNIWTNTVFPRANTNIGWVNATGTVSGDYHLACTSSFAACNASASQLSTDGTDLGADIDLVNMRTSGAWLGVPNSDVQAHLQVDAGSTLTVFRYTAPTAAACTATLYSAPARISTTQVASAADNAGTSISNGGDRQIPVTGLTPSTHYWYRLMCDGGTVIIGNYWTKASGSGIYPYTFQWSSATAMRYSSAPNMSSPTNLTAAAIQLIPVPSNSTIYAQVGTTGPVTVLIAP